MVKLLLLDIDGTLRPKGQSCVPPENVQALWLAAPLALAGADTALRSRYAAGMAALEAENKLLKEQIGAQAEQAEFYEDCIAEMATVVYA